MTSGWGFFNDMKDLIIFSRIFVWVEVTSFIMISMIFEIFRNMIMLIMELFRNNQTTQSSAKFALKYVPRVWSQA